MAIINRKGKDRLEELREQHRELVEAAAPGRRIHHHQSVQARPPCRIDPA